MTLPSLPQAASGTKKCPFCLEEIQSGAVRCRYCRTWLRGNALQSEWYRSPHGRIAGVCQGISEQFHISATFLRLLFILTTLFGAGMGLVAYITLWLIMPVQPESIA